VTAVVFAYHDVGCLGVRVLRRLGIEIAMVYTHDDDPTENVWFGSVRKTCGELGVPFRAGADMKDPAELAKLRALAPRAIFSFYYRDLLPDAVLECASVAAVNLHGSLLPRYRGRAPVNWMILHGEREGGVTLHHMVKRADAGDVVDQEPFPIGENDTPTDLFAKVLVAAERVLERSAAAVVEDTAPRWKQLESKATKFGRRRPEDGAIDWRQSAEDVRNLVRAVTKPYPGAFAFAGREKVLVWWAEHAGPAGALPPGTVRKDARGVAVACGDLRMLRLVRFEIGERDGDAAGILRDGIVLQGG